MIAIPNIKENSAEASNYRFSEVTFQSKSQRMRWRTNSQGTRDYTPGRSIGRLPFFKCKCSQCLHCSRIRAELIVLSIIDVQVLLTLWLPECLMEFCKVTLSFESVNRILIDVTIQIKSLCLYLHMMLVVFSTFYKMKFGQICFSLNLAVKGLRDKNGGKHFRRMLIIVHYNKAHLQRTIKSVSL